MKLYNTYNVLEGKGPCSTSSLPKEKLLSLLCFCNLCIASNFKCEFLGIICRVPISVLYCLVVWHQTYYWRVSVAFSLKWAVKYSSCRVIKCNECLSKYLEQWLVDAKHLVIVVLVLGLFIVMAGAIMGWWVLLRLLLGWTWALDPHMNDILRGTLTFCTSTWLFLTPSPGPPHTFAVWHIGCVNMSLLGPSPVTGAWLLVLLFPDPHWHLSKGTKDAQHKLWNSLQVFVGPTCDRGGSLLAESQQLALLSLWLPHGGL